MRGDGYYDVCNENYDVDAAFNNFPVKSFLPDYDVRNLTGSINARGHGFDFTDCGSTWTDATVNLASVRYNGTHYGNLKARGKLRGGYADVYAQSANRGCDLDVNAHGTICNDHYVFTADGNVRDLDLKRYPGMGCRPHAQRPGLATGQQPARCRRGTCLALQHSVADVLHV